MFKGFVCAGVVINLLVSIEILDIVDKISRKIELCYEIIRKNKE